jgi:hypothetical protein
MTLPPRTIEEAIERSPPDGDDGRELFHELDGLEQQMRSTIAPHRLELD